MIASTALYVCLLASALGAVFLVRPLSWFGIRSRRAAAWLAAAGAALAAAVALFPGPLVRSGAQATALDSLMPAYHFHEVHAAHIQAPPERALRALREVRPGEIRLFLLLTGIRSLRPARLLGEGVPPLEAQRPLLEVSQAGGFMVLEERPGREIVLGTCAQFWRVRGRGACPDVRSPEQWRAFAGPGYAKAAINFRIEPEGAGCRLTTETRILATDEAIKRRAEAPSYSK